LAEHPSGSRAQISTHWGSANAITAWVTSSSGYVRQASKQSSSFFGNGYFSYGAVFSTTAAPDLFVNGEYVSDASIADQGGNLTQNVPFTLVGNAYRAGTNYGWNSRYKLLGAAAINGRLSASDFKNLHNNPMQAFVPA
jgi:hypothetical protein